MEPAQSSHPSNVLPSNEGIYLDYASSTPLDPLVIQAVCKTLGNNHGNVYANHHVHGQKAFEAVQAIEAQILKAIGANYPEEDRLIFTASSTESNNLALLGLVKRLLNTGKTHVITSAIEHKSLLGPAKAMAEKGIQVTFLHPDSEGYLSAETIAQALQENTGLVSLQAVNNEVGTLYPLEAIGNILSTRNILFHTDAAQGLGRTPFSIEKYNLDLASISAHKTYGPQGIGGLYVKQSIIPHMTPLFYDGGAGALRPGTMPVALCTGLGLACELAAYSPEENQRLEELRATFIQIIQESFPSLVVHGSFNPSKRVPGILSFRIPGVLNQDLVEKMPGFSFSKASGPATATAGEYLSHIIYALTGDYQQCRETIRLSFGRFTTQEEIKSAAQGFVTAAKSSPHILYLEQ